MSTDTADVLDRLIIILTDDDVDGGGSNREDDYEFVARALREEKSAKVLRLGMQTLEKVSHIISYIIA